MSKAQDSEKKQTKFQPTRKEKIGGGAYGAVYLEEYEGKLIAAKCLAWPTNTDKKKQLRREIECHRILSEKGKNKEDGYPMTCPEFKDFVLDDMRGECWILMEKMPFSLDQLTIEKKRLFPLTPLDKLKIMYGIAKCMMYLHLENIIHRDLKPENILLDVDLGVRLCDFGLARPHGDGEELSMTLNIGTPLYEAPETYGHRYGPKADVFSYGVVVYALLCRDEIWEFDDENHTKARSGVVVQRQITWGRRYKKGDIRDAYWKLITNCWAGENQAEAEDRMSFEEIVKYFETGFNDEPELRHLALFKKFVAGVKKDIAVYEKIKAKKNKAKQNE